MGKTILDIQKVSKIYQKKRAFSSKTQIEALKDVSLSVDQGEFFAVIGESGSGKSTLGKLILQMEQPTSGKIIFHRRTGETQNISTKMQVIFQNPDAALNPFMTVFDLVKEPLFKQKTAKTHEELVQAILCKVGLSEDFYQRFPQNLSGGQKQRVVIARALVTNPAFVVADEPVSSLDISLQAQIINLMIHLKEELGLTYFFISHDLSLVAKIADRIAVMHRGKVVEVSDTKTLIHHPQNAYTKKLLAAEFGKTFPAVETNRSDE